METAIPEEILKHLEPGYKGSGWIHYKNGDERLQVLLIICLYSERAPMLTALFNGLETYPEDYRERWQALLTLEFCGLAYILWESDGSRPDMEAYPSIHRLRECEKLIKQIYVHPRLRYELEGYEYMKDVETLSGIAFKHRIQVPGVPDRYKPGKHHWNDPEYVGVHMFEKPVFPNVVYNISCVVTVDRTLHISFHEQIPIR